MNSITQKIAQSNLGNDSIILQILEEPEHKTIVYLSIGNGAESRTTHVLNFSEALEFFKKASENLAEIVHPPTAPPEKPTFASVGFPVTSGYIQTLDNNSTRSFNTPSLLTTTNAPLWTDHKPDVKPLIVQEIGEDIPQFKVTHLNKPVVKVGADE